MWRKAMVSLGLVDDDEYDDPDGGYPEELDRGSPHERSGAPPVRASAPVGQPAGAAAVGASPTHPDDPPSAVGAVRPITARPDDVGSPSGGHTASPTGAGAGVARPRPQVVRPIAVTPNAKPHLVVPSSFNQAQEVADKFKQSQPVVMNLQGSDRELSRRLIDFASGLCYGLGGQMERVANQVYLLTPSDVEVSAEERRRMHERGYDA